MRNMFDHSNKSEKMVEEVKKKGGPPNRMNDLPYKEWMKFQKSFYKIIPIQNLITQFIEFFTKEYWETGHPSRSLILTAEPIDLKIENNRNVDIKCYHSSITTLLKFLYEYSTPNSFDFIFISLPKLSKVDSEVFLGTSAMEISKALSGLLIENRYCSVHYSDNRNSIFTWELGQLLRSSLILRDEKVGIKDEFGNIEYCLILQKGNDKRQFENPVTIRKSQSNINFKSFIIPKPPPRNAKEILHPAKFPETLIEEFIKIFTKEGDNVFDPMLGTGSTVIAALNTNRNGFGTELIPEFADIAKSRVNAIISTPTLFEEHNVKGHSTIVCANAINLLSIEEIAQKQMDYVITSPPYWSMLTNKGSENQRKRRNQNLKLQYSQESEDVGNTEDYDTFLNQLDTIYNTVGEIMKPGAVITIIVKNVKRNQTVYPLAWDLVFNLCNGRNKFSFLGYTLWCQEDIGLKPFAVGAHWTSNTLHQYCLHLIKL